MTFKASDGSEQTVTFLYRDALSAAQHWLLSHECDIASDMQFEPELAATASAQVAQDYRHSLPNAVACAHLPRGQFTFMFEMSSDASQYGGSRQQFHPVYISHGCLRTPRRSATQDAHEERCGVATRRGWRRGEVPQVP